MPDGQGAVSAGPLSALVPLAGELSDLKRIRDASSPDSLACRMFHAAWSALVAGEAPTDVALGATADALAACRLGGIDRFVLERAGLDEAEALAVLARGFDEVAGPVEPGLGGALRDALGRVGEAAPSLPAFVEALILQPRAGATCPGRPRLVLEPPETHGDHCLVVAVLGVVLSGHYGARPALPFLAGLAHHLHNAVLPDSGFAGEMLLGAQLQPIMRRLFARELDTLSRPLAAAMREALAAIADADTPEGRAFHAADVIDRVLQMRQYARAASFTTEQALEEMELVHAGPLQRFHYGVLAEAGLP